MHTATETPLSMSSSLDDSWNGQTTPGAKELRVALAAQRDRVFAFSLSAVVAVLANRMGVLEINYPASLFLLATGLTSALVFRGLAQRSHRNTGRVNLVRWWLGFDLAIITIMIPFTGGLGSPWWIWYLTCAGTAALHRDRRSVVAVSGVIAALYVGVLVVEGDIHGLDHGLFLALSRLVFLGVASAGMLVSQIKLRETGRIIRELRRGAEARADELRRLNGELQDMADLLRDLTLTDALTGLRNRRYVKERIADAAARRELQGGRDRRASKGGQLNSGFLMLDLDNFKTINDLYGHDAGDRALKHVAQVLRRAVREDDLIARWGGDEFVVMLPHANLEQLARVAEKVGHELRSKPVRLSDQNSQMLTFSIGYALVDPQSSLNGEAPWHDALAAADGALYAAKQEGRNCAHGAQPDGSARSALAV